MTILVTGGSGFLGGNLIQYLQKQGEQVRSFDLTDSPHAETIIGDLRDADAVMAACAGVDTVFHTASAISQQLGQPQMLHDVNVRGTENIIAASQQQGVKKLIYTSSIDVVFDGSPIRNGDETLPYARHHLDYYGTTKMIAEKAVLAANGQVATTVLRTAGIYGPRDHHRFPAILRSVLSTGTHTIIGNGQAQFTHVYVENVSHAHSLAAQRLTLESALAGQVYFITDEPPSNFFHFFIPYFDAMGINYQLKKLPYPLAWGIASLLETRYRLQPTEANSRIIMSRYVVASTARDFWFNHDKATRDFDYQPIVSAEGAFAATLNWAKAWVADNRPPTA
jgi:nucleoside-diphosphate-sugar epimerase